MGVSGDAVVGNPPANAGDTGSGPGLGRSHMLRSSWARAPRLLSCALEPVLCDERGHRGAGPAHGSEEWPPLTATKKRKPTHSHEDPTQPKINKLIN